MAITSIDGYIGSSKQAIEWFRSASRVTIAAQWFSLFDLAGQPGGGTLAGTSTTAGVVLDDTVTGYPAINAFGGGGSNLGYLTRFNFGNSVACRIGVWDILFKAGAYAGTGVAQNLTSQPSYAGRIPNSDYTGTELWITCVVALAATLTVTVTYTNQAGTAGQSTGPVSVGGALTIGRAIQLPLAAGDTGIQKVESVTATGAGSGTFNVSVLRPLAAGRVTVSGGGDAFDLLRTGMPQVFATTAFHVMVASDTTSSGVPEITLEVANA
jgi:hypothetical protein